MYMVFKANFDKVTTQLYSDCFVVVVVVVNIVVIVLTFIAVHIGCSYGQ